MYEVISDVERYYEFVPYCLESRVELAALKNDSGEKLVKLRVGWDGLEEQFLSTVLLEHNRVTAEATNNKMFKELRCEWQLKAIKDDKCMADLQLRFKFQNPVYNMLMQRLGSTISKKMIEAFSARATSLHRGQ